MLLREKDRLALESIFSDIRQAVEVLAYGSRVSGAAHAGSDLDLCIKAADGRPLPHDLLRRLKTQLRDSNIPFLVELHDWARLPASFHDQIGACNEVLFTSFAHNASQTSET